jgi:hypothetical protein
MGQVTHQTPQKTTFHHHFRRTIGSCPKRCQAREIPIWQAFFSDWSRSCGLLAGRKIGKTIKARTNKKLRAQLKVKCEKWAPMDGAKIIKT